MNILKRTWKKITATVAAALAAIGIYIGAYAQVVTDRVSWDMPTQRVDGTALPVSEIAKTTIAWGTSVAGPFTNTQDVAAPTTTFTFTRGTPGTGMRCYVLFVTDTDGRVGAQTPTPGCKTVKAAPGVPSNVAVQ